MSKRIMQTVLLGTAIVGLVLALASVRLGDAYVSKIMQAGGGMMDTTVYKIKLTEAIRMYREVGVSIFIVSTLAQIALMFKNTYSCKSSSKAD